MVEQAVIGGCSTYGAGQYMRSWLNSLVVAPFWFDRRLADGLGVQGVQWDIQWPGGEFREVVSFAREVIAKWEEFFVKHGIDQPPP
jgi:hypothetical protein